MAATPLVLLAQAVGWRMAFVFIAAVNLLLIAAFALAVPGRPPAPSAAESRRPDAAGMRPALAALMELLRLRDYWIISLGTFVRYGVYAAIQTLYAGPFLMQVYGLPAVAAGNVILLMNVGFICGGPIFGAISDRGIRSRKRVVAPGLTAMAVVIAVLALLPVHAGLTVLAALFFLLGLVNSTGGIMYSHIKERMPLKKSGTAMTGINFFTMIGPAVFLQALGLFMQAWFPAASLGAAAFDAAFVVCAASLLIAAILYGFTRDTGNGA
jgi:predicted MFS family arabinose efflux permease